MKAYTSSNSSSAMSVARVALGRSTTSPADPEGATGSPGLWGSTVMNRLREQVPAEKGGRVRAPEVRPRVHDHVPGPIGGAVNHAGDGSDHPPATPPPPTTPLSTPSHIPPLPTAP